MTISSLNPGLNIEKKLPLFLPKAWFPSMRLTYSHVYSCQNKYNTIGRNAPNNFKKMLILQLFLRLFVYSHKNNIKTF